MPAAPRTLCLFDVDGTLSLARQQIKPATLDVLLGLRAAGTCAIGFLGGSNLAKILEQLQLAGRAPVLDEFDYGFAENGLTAFKAGRALDSQSFIGWLGEERYKQLVKFLLRYISELDLPVMR
jgi:phosphomannomutase